MTAAEDLFARWADIAALESAMATLGWDQETHMPPRGREGRGRVLAALAGMRHAKLADPALTEAIEAAAAQATTETATETAGAAAENGEVSDLAAQVREARRVVRRATAVPEALTRRMAEVESRALAAWQRARAEDDFSLFTDDLEETVELTREAADALVDAGIATTRYDALLDAYEPGATEAELAPLLAALADRLAVVVAAVSDSGITVDESCVRGEFPAAAQEAFGRLVAETMGYDFDAGRLDASAHPFSTTLGPGDTRITWRWDTTDFRPGLFGIMHEAGHALYEQGLPATWAATPLGEAVSLGIHESQSRLWENLVGRSASFWTWALPRFQETFGGVEGIEGLDLDTLLPALHVVRPSLIRVEADEVTYNLHVVARFEIERRLVAGDIAVADLPELWDTTYHDLLSVRPSGAADGVLQDIHWSMGAFGYFPTYALGNLVAAQLMEAARRDVTDLDAAIAAGDLAPLLGWLRHHIHAHGRHHDAADLVQAATGRPLAADAFLAHVDTTVEATYGIRPPGPAPTL